jgi:hypothetical protein
MSFIKNKIQVFGLPRSGTNFVEWTLRNNFVGIDYNVIDVINNVPGSFPHTTLLKHNYPTLQYSHYGILIYKPFFEWQHSLKKNGWSFGITQYGYQKYIEAGKSLGNKFLVVEWDWCVKNYNTFLLKIKNRFNVILIDNPIFPTKRLMCDSGITLSEEDFV